MLHGSAAGMQKLAARGIDFNGPRQDAPVFFAQALIPALGSAREAQHYSQFGLAKLERCRLRRRAPLLLARADELIE
jgi:hypothetical protein